MQRKLNGISSATSSIRSRLVQFFLNSDKRAPQGGIRAFNALLLSYLIIVVPFAQMARGTTRSGRGHTSATDSTVTVRKGLSSASAAPDNVSPYQPVPRPAPQPLAPTIVATKTDGIPAATTVAPGGTITYTVNISNTGALSPADDATGVTYTDTIDAHTTLVNGSLVAAVSDSYNAIGNTQISLPDGATDLLANDFDPDTGNNVGMTVTAYGAATGTEQTSMGSATATSQGGTVTVQSNGSFNYDPPAGFEGTDTFKYRAADSGGATAITTVKISIAGMIWYVNNNAGACTSSCNGRLSHPFQTLAAFQAVNNGAGNNPAAGDNIFLYESATAYVGPVTLLNNQKLIGQDATASLASIAGVTAPSGPDPLPAMNSANATIVNVTGANANGINLVSGNTLRGFTVGNVGTGTKISGSGLGTLTVGSSGSPDVTLSGTGRALNLSSGTVSANFTSVASTSSSNDPILLNQLSGSFTVAGSTTISGATFGGIRITSPTPGTTFNFAGGASVTTDGGGGAGVTITATTAATITFNSLSITNTNGMGLSASASNVTTVINVTNGTGSINTTNGAAVSVSSATLNANFSSVSSTGGTNGIRLISITGTSSFGTGTITNSTADLFTIQNGSPTVTYNGNITQNTDARVIQIFGTTAGSTTLGGTVTGGNLSTNINAGGNGDITFTTINLGTAASRLTSFGISIAGTGARNLGVVNVFTSGQIGLRANSGGTGLITSTSGTIDALNQTAIDIGGFPSAVPLNIQLTKVNATGTLTNTRGIVLNNTTASGSPGGFRILGSGGNCTAADPTCTGGRIQNTTDTLGGSSTAGKGVYLNNAASVVLTRMRIDNHQNNAIFGQGVNGFTLANSLVDGANGGGGDGTDAVFLNNVSGNISISDSDISGAKGTNVVVNGALSGAAAAISISNCTIHDNDATTGGKGLAVGGGGGSAISITGNTFRRNRQEHFVAGGGGTVTPLDVFFSGNTLKGLGADAHPNAQGQNIQIGNSFAGIIRFNILNNTINGAVKSAIILLSDSSFGESQVIGSISGNTVGTTGVANSGSSTGHGIEATAQNLGVITVNITNNQIRRYALSGIALQGFISPIANKPALDTTITGNTIKEPTAGIVRRGVHVFAGDTSAMCFDFGGAGALENDIVGAGPNTVAGTEDFFIANSGTASLRLPAYGGAGTDTAAIIAYIQNRNAGTPTGATSLGSAVTGGASCTQPTFPIATNFSNASGRGNLATALNREAVIRPITESELEVSKDLIPIMQSHSLSRLFSFIDQLDALGSFAHATSVARRVGIVNGLVEDPQRAQVRTNHFSGRRSIDRAPKVNTTAEKSHLRSDYAKTSRSITPVAGETVTANLGTLPAGGSVTITFQVTVNNPPNLSLLNPARVENQGTVTANGGISVTTDDPETGAAGDKTVTRIDLFDTTTSLASDNNPSNQGSNVTFTATIVENPAQAAVDMTGTVDFIDTSDSNTVICNDVAITPDGANQMKATCTTSTLSTAITPHNIQAVYSGDGNFDPSTSNTVAQVVNPCGNPQTVTNTNDAGPGSLRQSLIDVCDNGVIDFNLGVGPNTITLTTGELSVAKNVTIKNVISAGNGPVTISGGNTSRVFNINSGKTVSLVGLTISGGAAASGAGIVNDGALTVVNSTLTGNNATADGGGITTSASATSLTLINTTISGNNANGNGGGIAVLGGTMTSINSTVTNNKADNDNNATGTGGGIAGNSTTVLKNTIVAGNFNEDGASDAPDDISGTIDTTAASSFNLIGTGGAGGLANGVNNNQINVASPGLGPLQNNGGPSFTHALLSASPAIEAGGNSNLPTDTFDLDGDANTGESLPVDQRGTGFPRIADSADPDAIQTVDVGAYESHPTVEDITDKTTAEDNAVPQITFNIGDGTGALISSVTATSSNITLIPNANVLVGGLGSTRTLDITPAANENSPADGTATITVTVTATNGRTAVDTFVVTVTEVNDAPVPANDTVPDIAEDCSSGCTGAKYVIPFATLLSNDLNKGAPNESGQSLTITNVSLPTGGTVAINGTNVEFTPTADFSGPAGFTYTATDNGTTNGVLDAKSGNATVSFNITAVNDNPVLATNAGITVNEGSSNNTITNTMLSVTDVDNTAAQIVFTMGTAPANGTLRKSGGALAAGGTFTQADINSGFITYDHNGSETTSDSFTFTVSDGAGGSIGLTSFNITVTPVNDAPALTTTGGNLAYTENDPATVIDSGVTITDADSANLVGATVSITANFDVGKDVLSWTDNNLGDNITLSGTSTAQTIVLTGTDTVANYQAALRAVKYQNTSDNPSILTRTVTFSANDGIDTGSNTRGIDVTAVNDIPSFTKGPDQTVSEDAGPQTVSNWATNISAGPEESGQTVNFIVSNNNNALFSVQPAVSAAGVLTYTPAANAFGSATIDVQIHDNGGTSNGGQDTSAVQQFTITVTAVADTPSVTNTTTLEDTASSTNLVITRNPADGAEVTHFKITNIQNGTLFKHDGTTQINSGDFILVADAANVGGFGLVFKPNPDFNSNIGSGNFDIQASTSGANAGLGGGVITATITVTPVNDTPSFTKGPDINVNANSGAHNFAGWATNIQKGPATATDETSQTVNFIVTNNNNPLFSVQPAVAANGTLSFSVAPAAFGQATVSVQIHDNGGGADTSAIQTFIITVTSVDLTPTKSHVGPWKQGDTGKTYTISVKNIGQDASVGLVTLADSLPAGLIARSLSGSGWTCDPIPGGGTPGPATLNCTRSDALAGGVNATYPDITLTVDIACNAPANVTNSATVSGGNDASPGNNTSADATVINPDNIPPVIVCPGGISKYTDSGQNTAAISVQPAVATDNCGNVTVTGVRSDGKPLNAPFPKGITIITWTAKDAANNTATCAQSITVMVPSSPHRIPGDEPEEALLIVTDLVMTVLSAVW